ncbi:hypothetical protein M569_04689 [Genlisea aurea]|uniref:Uncharacterized protein n=1 Tax=Genlisea aurea TaxID=192259 RepID=S8E300_9LAMI|nr:hypothetical protein M569_04689 [Genlisea aurea]
MAEEGEESEKIDAYRILFEILGIVNRIPHDSKLSVYPTDSLVELRAASNLILSLNPVLFNFSEKLRQLADSIMELQSSKPVVRCPVSFVTHRLKFLEVSRLVSAIESEIQMFVDRELLLNLKDIISMMRNPTKSADKPSPSEHEAELLDKMSVLQKRLSRSFDLNFQDSLLRSRIFSELEWILRNQNLSKPLREQAAICIIALLLFNKDVFVGSIIDGGTVEALVSMGSCCSLLLLSSLIKAIKSPLVDELESSGSISYIIDYLSSEEVDTRSMALYCIMQIVHFGRKEAVEALINSSLIRKLVELQRMGEKQPLFLGCLTRFVVQLEVGEGVRQRDAKILKVKILNKVREASACEAEFAAFVAEILWGSSL